MQSEINSADAEGLAGRGQRSVQVAARLRQLIVAGQLAPGQRIGERWATEQLGDALGGVSRTPLREAFKILEAEGLVTIEPNRGAVVTRLGADEVAATLDLLIHLEAMAAEAACQLLRDTDLARIEALHTQMAEAHRQGAALTDGPRQAALMRYFELNQQIHQHIVDAAGNPVLSRIYAAESARIRRYRYAGNLRAERWAEAVHEHEGLLTALRQRAGALLREMLRQHHRNGWRVARTVLEPELAAGATAATATPAEPRRRGRPPRSVAGGAAGHGG